MKIDYKLNKCPICGGRDAKLRPYYESSDGRADKPAYVYCNCGLELYLTSKEFWDAQDKYNYKGGYYSQNVEFWEGMHQMLIDKWNNIQCADSTEPAEFGMNMKVKDLKAILASIEDLELDGIKIDTDEMDIIIPVVNESDKDSITGFRHVRTAGILASVYEPDVVLCLSAPDHGMDMESHIQYSEDSGSLTTPTTCKKVLF